MGLPVLCWVAPRVASSIIIAVPIIQGVHLLPPVFGQFNFADFRLWWKWRFSGNGYPATAQLTCLAVIESLHHPKLVDGGVVQALPMQQHDRTDGVRITPVAMPACPH